MVRKDYSNQKGQSLVEMAISFTIILFLLMATVDFGFAYLNWITLRDAAQEGAIFGSLHAGVACETKLRGWVKSSAESGIINMADVQDGQIIITRSGSTPGNVLRVEVTHPYHLLTPLVPQLIGSSEINLSARIASTVLVKDTSCP